MSNKKEDKLKKFKQTIKQLESSGGKNFNHSPISTGVNKGQVAGGAYGILPNTLDQFVNSDQHKGKFVDPRLKAMSELPSEVVTQILNEDRELDEAAADLGMRQVLPRTNWDEEKAAYGWNQGHNRDFKSLPQDQYKSFPYVQDYKEEAANPSVSPSGPKEEMFFEKIKRMVGNKNGQQ